MSEPQCGTARSTNSILLTVSPAFLQNLLFLRPNLAHLLGGMEKLSVESTYPHWYVCFKGKEEETWTLLVPEKSSR